MLSHMTGLARHTQLSMPIHDIWVLATLISSFGPSISNVTFDIQDFDNICAFDFDILHLRYPLSILKDGRRYSISKVSFFDIGGLVILVHLGFDIEYDIALSQCHSLQSRSSICPGSITPAPKSLSATYPGFMHPLFAQFHSLIHRDLTRTRKGPSIAPRPHVDFESLLPVPLSGLESAAAAGAASFGWKSIQFSRSSLPSIDGGRGSLAPGLLWN
jgi:hypothetical protein